MLDIEKLNKALESVGGVVETVSKENKEVNEAFETLKQLIEEKKISITPPDFGSSETMSLIGGIDIYSFFDKRFKSDISPKGRKVKYLNKNGYDINREYANRYFNEGKILTIKEIWVGRSGSEVEFEEFPNKKFNTVMFADVVEK